MALISCPECKKEISDKAKTCPHCGYPFDEQGNTPDEQPIIDQSEGHDNRFSVAGKKLSRISKVVRTAIIAIVAICLVALVALMSTSKSFVSSDISYKVPSSWQYSEIGTDHYHYPPTEGMLFVGYHSVNINSSDYQDVKKNLEFAYTGFVAAGSSYKQIKSDYVSFKTGSALSAEYYCDYGHGVKIINYFSFVYNQNIYIVALAGYSDSEVSMRNKMDKIIKTIKLNET